MWSRESYSALAVLGQDVSHKANKQRHWSARRVDESGDGFQEKGGVSEEVWTLDFRENNKVKKSRSSQEISVVLLSKLFFLLSNGMGAILGP